MIIGYLFWALSGMVLTVLLYFVKWYKYEGICGELFAIDFLASILVGPVLSIVELFEYIQIQRFNIDG